MTLSITLTPSAQWQASDDLVSALGDSPLEAVLGVADANYRSLCAAWRKTPDTAALEKAVSLAASLRDELASKPSLADIGVEGSTTAKK